MRTGGGLLNGSNLERVCGGVIAGRPSSDHPAVGYLIDTDGTRVCAATLIRPNVVMSAAHCFDDELLRFVPGEYDPSNRNAYEPRRIGDERTPFARIHPGYADGEHDLGYMVLKRPVQEVAPAAIGDHRDFGTRFETVGYGRTADPPIDGLLSTVDPERVGAPRKEADLEWTGVDPDAGWLEMHGVDGSVCKRDSGAGLFAPGTESLVGVLHGGERPCGIESLVRYTPLSGNTEFVEEALAVGEQYPEVHRTVDVVETRPAPVAPSEADAETKSSDGPVEPSP